MFETLQLFGIVMFILVCGSAPLCLGLLIHEAVEQHIKEIQEKFGK
jgi:hypothetical protein